MFGLLAALTKASVGLLSDGAGAFFTGWQPYAMAVVAVAGAVVQQSAFQAGPLAASVPVMDAVEPTVAVLIGVAAFGEEIARGPAAVAVESLAVLLVLAGIAALDTSPLIRARAGEEAQPATRVRRSSANSGYRDATVSSGNSSSIDVTG